MNIENMVGMGWMMAGAGLVYVLVIILLVLGIAALIKYVFVSGRRTGRGPH